MCRVTAIFGKDTGNITKAKAAQQLLVNGCRIARDGYFIKAGSLYLRTMDVKEYVRSFRKNQNQMHNAPMIFMHQRQSTNQVKQDFVHGWKLGKYYCAHNGIGSHIISVGSGNDSLDLFTHILLQKEITPQSVVDAYEEDGSGTYFMLDETGSGFIFGDTVYVAIPEGQSNVWAFSSKADVFDGNLRDRALRKIAQIGVLPIFSEVERKIETYNWTLTKYEDVMIVLEKGYPVKKLPCNKKVKSYLRSEHRGVYTQEEIDNEMLKYYKSRGISD